MIPEVVPRKLLTSANGIFILTLNAAFALGFALLGPARRQHHRLRRDRDPDRGVAVLRRDDRLRGAAFGPAIGRARDRAPHEGAFGAVVDAEHAVASTIAELREGIGFIQSHRNISWSLVYLGITASLVGVLGVLGPDFAEETLGLTAKDLAVVVLPMGFGIVMGILLLNAYGKYVPRRRVIEGGLIALGVGLLLLSIAGRISQFLSTAEAPSDLLDLSVRDVAARDRRGARVLRGDRLRLRRDPVADAAPGGPAGGCPGPRLRRAEHAGVDRQLPADHHRRAVLGPGRDDGGDPGGGDRRSSSPASPRSCCADRCGPRSPRPWPIRTPSTRSPRPSGPTGRPGTRSKRRTTRLAAAPETPAAVGVDAADRD